jgi:hypothetical protein
MRLGRWFFRALFEFTELEFLGNKIIPFYGIHERRPKDEKLKNVNP